MKLLILSHNPVSRHNAMGKTLAAFLDAFSPEEVCQLYIYPAYPREGVCGSFFRITDRQILNRWLLGPPPGGTVDPSDIGRDYPGYDSPQEERIYQNRWRKGPFFRWLRDLLWAGESWFHPGLKQWLDREQPDCILAAGGDGCFLYRIAMKLSQAYSLPLVGYVCDEYYFLSPKWPLAALRQRQVQNTMEAFLQQAAHLVVISRELEQAYAPRFFLPVTVLMTGASLPIRRRARWEAPVTTLVYLGNLSYGRCRSLAAIGRALAEIEDQTGWHATLEIYSAQQDPAFLQAFSGISTICFRGFVSGDAVAAAMDRAQLLVHSEDFSPENVALVRHSVSTKIPDCLASGIPLLAYGPGETASMAYLMEHDCAFVSVEEGLLIPVLEQALFSPELRRQKAEAALALARRNHDRRANSLRFKALLESLREDGV